MVVLRGSRLAIAWRRIDRGEKYAKACHPTLTSFRQVSPPMHWETCQEMTAGDSFHDMQLSAPRVSSDWSVLIPPRLFFHQKKIGADLTSVDASVPMVCVFSLLGCLSKLSSWAFACSGLRSWPTMTSPLNHSTGSIITNELARGDGLTFMTLTSSFIVVSNSKETDI